ncbi:hypothetical protein MUK42_01290 [Musa troglodytarum]|uniref:RRM domain-containing protein n=1 Tax=Musa troglodytarum TaxID=320322 RepID=A0A9E7EVX5_9LILI|nr:hypothetical protein MUK42_01290 [Musa troglodytarum]
MASRRIPGDLATGLLLLFSLISTLSAARFSPPDNHLIACGASSAADLDDGRAFLPDSGLSPPVLRSHGRQISLSNPSPDAAPLHRNARVFACPSSYEFEIKNTGIHRIRLHFYPFSTPEYDLSSARFHVLASDITLLSYFGTSSPVMKEYFINLNEGKLVISFSPADRSSFAFVNAIEVMSAPKDLILDAGRLVKPDEITEFHGLSKQALETLYRVNIGGPKVTPFNDTLWRTWVSDVEFLKLSSASKVVTYSGRIKYRKYGASREVAPDNVYNTARATSGATVPGSNYSMTWEFPVSSGYKYLVRMHFCDIASLALNQLYFNVYLNGYLAYRDFDLSDSTGQMLASPYYVDFVVDVDVLEHLSISIGPSNLSNPSWIRGLLNGLEIMKINNTMGSLDGKSPVILSEEASELFFVNTCGFGFMSLSVIAFMLFVRWRSESRSLMTWSRLPVDVSNAASPSVYADFSPPLDRRLRRRYDFLWHTRGPKRGEPRGYAFIQYSAKEEALLAKSKMNGRFVSGRPLVVRLASEKHLGDLESKFSCAETKDNDARSTPGQMNRNAKIAAIRTKLKSLEEQGGCATKKPRLLTNSLPPGNKDHSLTGYQESDR